MAGFQIQGNFKHVHLTCVLNKVQLLPFSPNTYSRCPDLGRTPTSGQFPISSCSLARKFDILQMSSTIGSSCGGGKAGSSGFTVRCKHNICSTPRVVKSGPNKGKQFYGCVLWPK